VLRQYLNTIKAIGYYLNFLRSDKGRETPIMANAYYFLYYTACFNDILIPDDVFNQISFNDCYIYRKSIGNIRIESLWNQMISGITKQWIFFFLALKRSGWFRKDLPCDKAVLTFIFMPIL
jgi:hypothetical protein